MTMSELLMACTLGFSRWQTRLVRTFVVLLALSPLTPAMAAGAACPGRPDALGTSRVLAVDISTPRVGRKHFPVTLPLADKEVVLTFDDGPLPGTTDRVLAALKAECVHATFFLLGHMVEKSPALARRERAEGHTIASHSYGHPLLGHMRPERAMADINRGFAAIDTALGANARAPFFRFPGFVSSPALLDLLAARGIVVFGADEWASDWNPMTPEAELRLTMGRIHHARGGILLLHDTKAQTAAMLPSLLRALKAGGYRIVHVVPSRFEASSRRK
jgi:peptidoglycan/xylan/chitin deacetylase (PgdA/CDA1 family)